MRAFVERLLKWLRSTLGKGTAGISVFATLAWFLWPSQNWHVQPDALAALVIALVAWIASLTSDEKSATEHDRRLLQKFRALLTDSEKEFLRTYDLGNTFSWRSLKGTKELAERWQGAEYEFDDGAVQSRFAQIIADARELIRRMSLGTWIVTVDDKLASPVPDSERNSGEISQKTWAKIKDFNDRATKLSEDIDRFIKFARQSIAD